MFNNYARFSNILWHRLIPAGDAPEEWGEDYLEVARERVMEARRGIFDCDPNVEPKGWSESCATM